MLPVPYALLTFERSDHARSDHSLHAGFETADRAKRTGGEFAAEPHVARLGARALKCGLASVPGKGMKGEDG